MSMVLPNKFPSYTGIGTQNKIAVWQGEGVLDEATDTYIDGNKVGLGTGTINEKLELNYGHLRINQEQIAAAPTVAINVTAGNLNGNYRYKITFVTVDGETQGGVCSAQVSPVNQQVDLTNIPIGTSKVIARKIYRTIANEVWPYPMKLVTTIADNITTIYTDNIADGSLGSDVNLINNTGGLIFINSEKIFEINETNSYIGYYAAKGNMGVNLTCFGVYAAYLNEGSNVSCFGGHSCRGNIGRNISAIGYYSGRENEGEACSFLGVYSGYLNEGSSVVAIGYEAGYQNTTNNQFIVKQNNVNSTPLIQGNFSTGNVGIGLTNANTRLHINGGLTRNVTIVNAATYDLLITDDILHVTYTTTGPVTSLTLPTAQTVNGRTITIKDASGNSTINNITIDTEGSEKIDGQDTRILNSDYESVQLYSDGTNWFEA